MKLLKIKSKEILIHSFRCKSKYKFLYFLIFFNLFFVHNFVLANWSFKSELDFYEKNNQIISTTYKPSYGLSLIMKSVEKRKLKSIIENKIRKSKRWILIQNIGLYPTYYQLALIDFSKSAKEINRFNGKIYKIQNTSLLEFLIFNSLKGDYIYNPNISMLDGGVFYITIFDGKSIKRIAVVDFPFVEIDFNLIIAFLIRETILSYPTFNHHLYDYFKPIFAIDQD